MRREYGTKRYEDWYAKILRLYPKGYQRQFSEPMRQTFGDMCKEHSESDGNMFGFVLKAYADTGVGILKECSKEVVMNTKASKAKLFIVAGSISTLVIIGGVAFALSNRQSSIIQPSSSLEQAREMSKGKKDACLADNDKAITAVKADDKYLDEAKEFSSFELAASEGIMDVPAGTNYETTINNYSDGQATGAVSYEKDYGKYNYTIKKLSGVGEWRLVSMVACE
jgi:hypothetical protein